MRFSTDAIMLVATAVVMLSYCTTGYAQSVDITGDVPGVRFTVQDVQACDPFTQVLADPRASGFKNFVKELGQTEGLRTLFNARAGTIILPTEQAFEDFMDLNGYGNLTEMINKTGGQSTWVPLISSYFLANTSNPPKDIVLPGLFSTPFGQASVAYGVYGPTPRYALYVYVDLVEAPRGQFQMVSGYLRFLAPNSTGLGAIVRSGPAANLTDFAIACDQYYVYFTDDLRVFGQAIPTGRASLTDLSTGQPAVVPSLTSSSSNGTRGRRLVAGVDVQIQDEWLLDEY